MAGVRTLGQKKGGGGVDADINLGLSTNLEGGKVDWLKEIQVRREVAGNKNSRKTPSPISLFAAVDPKGRKVGPGGRE